MVAVIVLMSVGAIISAICFVRRMINKYEFKDGRFEVK